jgi:membrane fusion protein (multidrug efflux system)
MTQNLISQTAVFLSLLALLVPFSGCKRPAAPPVPPEVEVVAIEQRDVPIYTEVVGTLQANVNAVISAQASGYLLQRDYREGQPVKKGDLLFQIDDRTYKAVLDQALAKLTKTDQDVQRLTPLAKTQAVSQQELDDAIQNNLAAKAAVEQARLNFEFCRITSPIDGVAGLAQADVGDLVGPGTGPLTTVAQIDPMRAYFSISQQLMTELMERRVAEGREFRADSNSTPLELTLATGTVYPLKGYVRYSDNQVDVKTGTIRVVGEFPNPQNLLVPGMFVRVRAQLGTDKDALLVPQRAVADRQGRYLIAVVGADNKVSIRPVQVGQRIGSQCVVKGSVKAGDRVVAEGIQKVPDGAVVKPIPWSDKPATVAAAPAEKKKE